MIKKTARLLRKNQTQAEAVLWRMLRNRKLEGFKFVRQYPFTIEDMGRSRFAVADFYCHAGKLAIELDGNSHQGRAKIDKYRQDILTKIGIRTIRFTNDKVINDIKYVLNEISHNLLSTPPLSFKRGAGVS